MASTSTTFVIHPHPDGIKVSWPGYDHAFALFEIKGSNVHISDIFRDPKQEKGSAGKMLAAVFRHLGIARPSHVRMVNILHDQPTVTQIQRGVTAGETVLGKVIKDLATELGTTVTGWNHGVERGKLWIEGTFRA